MARSNHFNDPLFQKMLDDLQLADYWKTSPDHLCEDQVRRYFLYLKNEKKFAAGSLTVALSALKFFYRITCPRKWMTLEQLKVKGPKTLPEVITSPQVVLILKQCATLRIRVFFQTLYSLGLRLDEGLNLHVGDIDAERRMVHIHRGKGAKDHYIPLFRRASTRCDIMAG